MPRRLILLALFLSPWLSAAEFAPRVVVVAMFEVGQPRGDRPGELQYWVERRKLDREVPLAIADAKAHLSADGRLMAIMTGVGNTAAAATITALGLDPRFDLRGSYWVIAGIAGIDPADGSLGDAVWTDYIVDGDLSHEIDAREIPADWPTGYVPLRKTTPYAKPYTKLPYSDMVYALNPRLTEWAYQLTKDRPLADSEALQKLRAHHSDKPNALRAPAVLKGANLASSTFWHGKLLNQWANDWVRYHTEGRGDYVTTAMEDAGTLHALGRLAKGGRVNYDRVLLLRTASNFDMQAPGESAATSLAGESQGSLSAFIPSLEAAYQVGGVVVDALLAGDPALD